jgi:hypothetical protein
MTSFDFKPTVFNRPTTVTELIIILLIILIDSINHHRKTAFIDFVNGILMVQNVLND